MKQYEIKGFTNEGHLVNTFCTLGTSSFRISIHHTLHCLVQDNMSLPNIPSKKVTVSLLGPCTLGQYLIQHSE
ncbi:MAG: hypothetical protein RLZZ43_790 [Actinomycetota bacterium]